MLSKVNLEEKFKLFSDFWSPKIIGELNDVYIKLAKFKGEFTWHHHDDEDELFLVVDGQLTIELRNQTVMLAQGEFLIIPKGVEHRPIAKEEAHVILIESKTTLNTGNVTNALTQETLERL